MNSERIIMYARSPFGKVRLRAEVSREAYSVAKDIIQEHLDELAMAEERDRYPNELQEQVTDYRRSAALVAQCGALRLGYELSDRADKLQEKLDLIKRIYRV